MTSKKLYHERKEAGLCTKCGLSLGESQSKTRCIECYEKFKKCAEKSRETKDQNKLCLGCNQNLPIENSGYCNNCQKNPIKKQNDPIIMKYNSQNQECRVCNKKIGTEGLICIVCLKNTIFTKPDAIARYGTKCSNCDETSVGKLRITSSNISQPMNEHGQDLFRMICYKISPPKEYKVICYSCYRTEDLNYIKELRKFFEKDRETDIIDVTNFEVGNHGTL